jgi:hypothetical protein
VDPQYSSTRTAGTGEKRIEGYRTVLTLIVPSSVVNNVSDAGRKCVDEFLVERAHCRRRIVVVVDTHHPLILALAVLEELVACRRFQLLESQVELPTAQTSESG